MTWSVNLIIQIIAGILGSHGAAVAVNDHRLGAMGHTVVGAVAGALGGIFLQELVVRLESDLFTEPTTLELVIGQGLAGVAVGAVAMMIVTLIVHERKSGNV